MCLAYRSTMFGCRPRNATRLLPDWMTAPLRRGFFYRREVCSKHFALSDGSIASTESADRQWLEGHMKYLSAASILLSAIGVAHIGHAQAWRNCVPGSIAPGGCDSIGPGGGRSIGPGGGQSIGPGGGRSIGPGGGQSIGPGGGQSIGPGGGKALNRDRSRGLNPDTLRPYENPYRPALPSYQAPSFPSYQSPSYPSLPSFPSYSWDDPDPDY
jgi:hypothetical protein